MRDDIIIIILSILTHYTLEFGKNMGDYTCPSYCKVNHKHIKENQDDWNNGYNDVEREKEEYLYRADRYDKHTSSK